MHEHPPASNEKPATGSHDPEEHEALARDGPRIYVASLSDYNDGILHGSWIEISDDLAALQHDLDEVLARSPTAARDGTPAEEWAIHDYENFGPVDIGEHTPLEQIVTLAEGIRRHGPAYAAWSGHIGLDYLADADFDDDHLGSWDTLEDYASDLLHDLGADRLLDSADPWLRSYLRLDVAGLARDLELGGDVWTAGNPSGGIWVFRST